MATRTSKPVPKRKAAMPENADKPKSRHCNKRSEAQKKLDRAEMVKLLRMGYSQQRIAERLNISQVQVSYDWNLVLKGITKEHDTDTKDVIAVKLAEIEEVKARAWQSYERSVAEKTRQSVEELQGTGGTTPKVGKDGKQKPGKEPSGYKKCSVVKENRDGGNEYLLTILKCIHQECELKGLYPDKKLSLKGKVTTERINFDEMAVGFPDGSLDDAVQRKVVEALEEQKRVIEQPDGSQLMLPDNNASQQTIQSDPQANPPIDAEEQALLAKLQQLQALLNEVGVGK